ncbi:hypothetical protein [Microseira wollei]|uniref:Uncharacterized protein n=1 Tax=Microseira wollei NIES-4236 TaxID=2530354 RepID=A0AAV3X8V0_9CYAN|nr:hypothetical protein [Microseira wollei]GET37761.1 hypothetical protein MiSe_25150 [Microseira wollei NIES-4236]
MSNQMRSLSQSYTTVACPVSASQIAMAQLVVSCVNFQDIYLVHRLLLDLGSERLRSYALKKI